MRILLDGEDTDVVVDLRHLNTGRRGEYDTFWKVRSQAHMYSLITHICTHPHIAIYIVHVHVHTSLIANLIYTCTHRNVKPFYMKTLALPSMIGGTRKSFILPGQSLSVTFAVKFKPNAQRVTRSRLFLG